MKPTALCYANLTILKSLKDAAEAIPTKANNTSRKDIKHMNNARLRNPSNVGGASGTENVNNIWLHHYQSLLNSMPGSPANTKKINESA